MQPRRRSPLRKAGRAMLDRTSETGRAMLDRTFETGRAMLDSVATPRTMYERAGGDSFFDQLTTDFYQAVATDAVLRPLYPTDDDGFERSRVHLRDFLIQYWGGPRIYQQTRGAPQLRTRHAGMAIGTAERDAWVVHMSGAVKRGGLRPLDEAQMLNYLTSAATHLINRPTP